MLTWAALGPILLTMETAIARAVEPLRTAAIERARKEAADLIERTFAKHAEDPKFHDYPVGIWNKRVHSEQKGRYMLLQALTKNGARDAAKCSQFVIDACEAASMQYTAFIAKLENKIGAHTTATLEGSHVWGYSILTVTLADGSIQCWKTQQIVNTSVLGTLFNQWPSRKVKR